SASSAGGELCPPPVASVGGGADLGGSAWSRGGRAVGRKDRGTRRAQGTVRSDGRSGTPVVLAQGAARREPGGVHARQGGRCRPGPGPGRQRPPRRPCPAPQHRGRGFGTCPRDRKSVV